MGLCPYSLRLAGPQTSRPSLARA